MIENKPKNIIINPSWSGTSYETFKLAIAEAEKISPLAAQVVEEYVFDLQQKLVSYECGVKENG